MQAIAESMKLQGDTVAVKSITHRLEDFFKEAELNYDMIALLLVFCLGQGKIRLCIDRTEWDFGTSQVNILMVIACNGTKHVPLYWELLDNNSGNSNATDRINLLENIIALLGIERIGIVIADREFIGHTWLKYLKSKGIRFCVRVPKHHLIGRLDGRRQSIEDLATEQPMYLKDCMVDGVWVNVLLKKLADNDYLFLIGTLEDPKHLGQVYRKRWTIETVFQSFKKRGFDIESTHIKAPERLKKLVALVSIAFAISISLGIYQHEKVQKIKTKNHGYKEKSFCRAGIDWVKDLCKQSVETYEEVIGKFLRYLISQKIKYDKNKLNPSLSNT
jgi:Transposase DDE domain